MSQPLLASGARGVVSYLGVDGATHTLGFALDISVSVNDSQQQTFVMGSLNAPGVDPTGTDVTASFSSVIPVNFSDSSIVDPSKLNQFTLGLQPTLVNVLTSNAIDIMLTDIPTGQSLAIVRGCRFAGKSLSSPAQGISTVRYNFVGILCAASGNTAPKLGYSSDQA